MKNAALSHKYILVDEAGRMQLGADNPQSLIVKAEAMTKNAGATYYVLEVKHKIFQEKIAVSEVVC